MSMSTQEFKEKLTAFFTEHQPKKLKFATRIAEKFRGNEELILNHLHKKYVQGIDTHAEREANKAAAKASAAVPPPSLSGKNEENESSKLSQ